MSNRDDPPCPACGENAAALHAEIKRLVNALVWITANSTQSAGELKDYACSVLVKEGPPSTLKTTGN